MEKLTDFFEKHCVLPRKCPKKDVSVLPGKLSVSIPFSVPFFGTFSVAFSFLSFGLPYIITKLPKSVICVWISLSLWWQKIT